MTQAPTTTTTTEVTDYYADPITVGSQVRRFTDYRRTLKVTRTNGTKVYTAWNGRERCWTGHQLVNVVPGTNQAKGW